MTMVPPHAAGKKVSTGPVEVAPPQPGEVWEHFKGARYQIITIAEGQGDPIEEHRIVIYRPVDDLNQAYARPLKGWHERMVQSHNAPMDPIHEWRFRRVPAHEQPCSCRSKPPDQNGFWDPACLQHGTNSEAYKQAMVRAAEAKEEREGRPSQDLWGGMDTDG